MACTLTQPDLRPQATDLFSIETFLELDREKDLLRFSTAGSVDDGKSTLIGRLLYDTQSVYDDQVRSIQNKGTAGKGTTGEQLDFALLTDGLRAEREQGITIDVAYRYFSTPRRKFIIADTPGHEQYTRNMATGASTADAAIVLVDARKGVLPQSRRHAYIATLLGVRHVIVAVNKMDLVGYDAAIFSTIQAEFESFARYASAETGHAAELRFIPVSALLGVNVVQVSSETPWYDGPSLLELLESLPTTAQQRNAAAFRLPVQRVIRPHQGFRGFAGQIASGAIRVGDRVSVLPSGKTSRVERIVTYDGDLDGAHAPLSITLTLEDELDISRGDLLTRAGEEAQVTRRFAASLVWMDARPLDSARRYLLKHTGQTVPAEVRLRQRVNLEQSLSEPAQLLEMNGIGVAEIETRRPIAFERYSENRTLGAFILIDAETNATVGAGMVREILAEDAAVANTAPVTPLERAGRWGHAGVVLRLHAPVAVIHALERALLHSGTFVVRPPDDHPTTPGILADAGALVLVAEERDDAISLCIGSSRAASVPHLDTSRAVASLLKLLREANILQRERVR
ncbi:MAG TPA: sulfate adenylyltransferase subunit CysN [Acidobacteriaceae bacterium]|jgi:sulfate adenylyltransferase large subunit|nr:sulfate adenylyltransferase subunit CysN [Acidobacteriaceae bacterium]